MNSSFEQKNALSGSPSAQLALPSLAVCVTLYFDIIYVARIKLIHKLLYSAQWAFVCFKESVIFYSEPCLSSIYCIVYLFCIMEFSKVKLCWLQLPILSHLAVGYFQTPPSSLHGKIKKKHNYPLVLNGTAILGPPRMYSTYVLPSTRADSSYSLHHISPGAYRKPKTSTHTHRHSERYKMMSAVKNYAVHHVLPKHVRQ